MIIRKATLDDFNEILRLNLKLFNFERQYTKTYNLNWTYSKIGKDYFQKRITEKNGIMFVAVENKTIIGYICGYVGNFPYRKPPEIAEIDNMYVEEGFRRSGIGKKLVSYFEKKAKKKGAKRIKVEALAGNLIGKNFYKKRGLKEATVYFEKSLPS